MKKLLNNHGESLIEVLVSLLIVCLCFLMLQGSIVTAAKINSQNKENIEPFIKDGNKTSNRLNVALYDKNGNPIKDSIGYDIKGETNTFIYQSNGGYYYYE